MTLSDIKPIKPKKTQKCKKPRGTKKLGRASVPNRLKLVNN